MSRPSYEEEIASDLAARTGTDAADWYLVFKARYGMQLAFEAIRAELGEGKVATQLLTCCTAVDPILVAGLEPVYAEVSACTASLDPEKLGDVPGLRAVVLQHTYGIVDDASSQRLAARAHEQGAALVEDCAHGVARMVRGADGAPLADISVHSFGIEKMLDCQFGGAVWVNPASPFSAMAARLHAVLSVLPPLTSRLDWLTRIYLLQNRVIAHSPLSLARWARRALPPRQLLEPPVSDIERRGGLQHPVFRPSASVCERALTALRKLDAGERLHVGAVEAYRREFADMPGVETFGAAMEGPAQPLLRFPILVHDTATADKVTDEVCAAGFYTTAWYRPELGPGVLDEEAYRVPKDRSGLSVCDRLVACVANLPCDVTEEGAHTVAEVVRRVVSS